MKSVDTFNKTATTSTIVSLSVTGLEFIVIRKSTKTACGLSIFDKVLHVRVFKQCNKYKKQHYE